MAASVIATAVLAMGTGPGTGVAAGQTIGGVSAKQPVILHAPVARAGYGAAISIQTTTSCTVPTCTAALYYRPTEANGQFFFGGNWARVDLQRGDTTFIPETGRTLVEWTGTIPSAVVMARGVDYLIEANDAGWVQRAPAYNGGDGDYYYHVLTMTPPLPAHVPPAFAQAGEPIPVEIDATCGRASCEATLYYRTSTEDVTVSQPRQWPRVAMDVVSREPLGEGQRVRFRASVPASYVDTRGVDYAVNVTDGELNAWSPGTTYQG